MDINGPKKPRVQKDIQREQNLRDTIMRLSEMADLIGLRTYIIKRTPRGKSNESDPWGHTRAYMRQYANPANTEPLIALLTKAGCENELQAVRWLLSHDDLVP